MAITSKASVRGDGGVREPKKWSPDVSGGVQAAADKLRSDAEKASAKTTAAPAPPEKQIESGGGTGGGGGSGGTQGSSSASATAAALPASSWQGGVDETRRLYETAAAALAEKQKASPTWNGSSYDAEIDDLYAQISGREKYSYDLNKDALWQQMKDSFTEKGKLAMADTMGQAAGLTGGYGSSYAQSVGQQAFDREIEKLLDAAPELEERAYRRYQDEGDELKDKLSLARALSADEFDKYLQKRSEWENERDFAAGERDTAYGQYVTERAYGDDQREKNRSKVVNLISIGYAPTDRELADAGMSRAEYAAIAAQYAPKKSGGGSKKTSAYQQALTDMKDAIAGGADQYEINTAIAANPNLTAEEKRKLMDQNTAPTSTRYLWDK